MSAKNRTTLKGYFATGEIPTESNFGDLIDSALIQTDDGLRFSGDGPLAIEANSGDSETPQNFLEIFSQFGDTNAAWRLNLNPETDTGEDYAAGFSIADGSSEMSRFFIRKTDGFVGIGTTSPVVQLDVAGDLRTVDGDDYVQLSGSDQSISWNDGSNFALKYGDQTALSINQNGTLIVKGDYGIIQLGESDGIGRIVAQQLQSRTLKSNGGYYNVLRINSNTKMGIGTQSPSATLHLKPVIIDQSETAGTAPYDASKSPVLLVQSDEGDDLLTIENDGDVSIPGTLETTNQVISSDYPIFNFLPNQDHGVLSIGSDNSSNKSLLFRTYSPQGIVYPLVVGRNSPARVGIGTKNPTAAFHVLPYQSDSWSGEINQDDADALRGTDPTLLVQSSDSTDALRIEADGAVTIGGNSGAASIKNIYAISVSWDGSTSSTCYNIDNGPNVSLSRTSAGVIELNWSSNPSFTHASTLCMATLSNNNSSSDRSSTFRDNTITASVTSSNQIEVHIWSNNITGYQTKRADAENGHDYDNIDAVTSVNFGKYEDSPFSLLVIQLA